MRTSGWGTDYVIYYRRPFDESTRDIRIALRTTPEYGRNRICLMRKEHRGPGPDCNGRSEFLTTFSDEPIVWRETDTRKHSQIRPELLTCRPRGSDGCTRKYIISQGYSSAVFVLSTLLCFSERL